MLSLDSSEDEAEVHDFAERVRDAVGEVTVSLEPKFDGFSVELVYADVFNGVRMTISNHR